MKKHLTAAIITASASVFFAGASFATTLVSTGDSLGLPLDSCELPVDIYSPQTDDTCFCSAKVCTSFSNEDDPIRTIRVDGKIVKAKKCISHIREIKVESAEIVNGKADCKTIQGKMHQELIDKYGANYTNYDNAFCQAAPSSSTPSYLYGPIVQPDGTKGPRYAPGDGRKVSCGYPGAPGGW